MFLSRSDMARISGGATSCSFGSGHQWRRRCAPPLLAQPTALRPRPPTATAARLSSPITTAMGWRRGRRPSLNRMEARARRWTSLKRMEARALTFSEADGGGVGARRECRTDLRAGLLSPHFGRMRRWAVIKMGLEDIHATYCWIGLARGFGLNCPCICILW
jgi:hypothetical protein